MTFLQHVSAAIDYFVNRSYGYWYLLLPVASGIIYLIGMVLGWEGGKK